MKKIHYDLEDSLITIKLTFFEYFLNSIQFKSKTQVRKPKIPIKVTNIPTKNSENECLNLFMNDVTSVYKGRLNFNFTTDGKDRCRLKFYFNQGLLYKINVRSHYVHVGTYIFMYISSLGNRFNVQISIPASYSVILIIFNYKK